MSCEVLCCLRYTSLKGYNLCSLNVFSGIQYIGHILKSLWGSICTRLQRCSEILVFVLNTLHTSVYMNPELPLNNSICTEELISVILIFALSTFSICFIPNNHQWEDFLLNPYEQKSNNFYFSCQKLQLKSLTFH